MALAPGVVQSFDRLQTHGCVSSTDGLGKKYKRHSVSKPETEAG